MIEGGQATFWKNIFSDGVVRVEGDFLELLVLQRIDLKYSILTKLFLRMYPSEYVSLNFKSL